MYCRDAMAKVKQAADSQLLLDTYATVPSNTNNAAMMSVYTCALTPR